MEIQTSSISWKIRNLYTGKFWMVSGSLNDSVTVPLVVTIPKAEAGLLQVKAAVSYPLQVVTFVMEGPYGTVSTLAPMLKDGVPVALSSQAFGQYLNTPLCLDGVQVYEVKAYNPAGDLIWNVELHIDLTV